MQSSWTQLENTRARKAHCFQQRKRALDIIPKQGAPLNREDKVLQPGTVTDIHVGSPITTYKYGLIPHHAVWGHTLHVQRIGRFEYLEGTELNVLMNKVYSGHPIGGICSGTLYNSLEILIERKWKLGNLLVVIRTAAVAPEDLSDRWCNLVSGGFCCIWTVTTARVEGKVGDPWEEVWTS